jgi:DNA-binding NarL/FixJ family response regulator
VRSYTKALLTKLGVRSRIEALAVARRAQLI